MSAAARQTVFRGTVALAGAVAVFTAFLVAKGADPLAVYQAMWNSTAGGSKAFGELLVQTTPFLLAALAVAVPARAGLFNIGGEGQLLAGAIGATVMANALGGALPTLPTLVLMALAGAACGAAWAGIAAVAKRYTHTSEAISTLLLNYLAILVLAYLVHGPWKDRASLGFPQAPALHANERLPVLWGTRAHAGILLALAAMALIWAVLRFTPWGFTLRVVGGNAEAARRAGLAVGGLAASAMLAGGALAGLGGMIELAGVEGRVRPGMMLGFGFIGFLASWLARHHPARVTLAALLLGAIAVGGNGLKITAGVSASAVNILMALVLLAVLGWGQHRGVGRSSETPPTKPVRTA
ncbi:MAG: ABC transporter permease [Egibacteraceae bacterium]